MKKILTLALLLFSAITLAACAEEEQTERIVYVTSYPVYYLVDSIGKDLVETRFVPGATVHGHGFEWSGQDIIAMQRADLLFYVGAGLDTFVDSNVETLTENDLVMIKLLDSITPLEVCVIDDHDDHDDHHDEDVHADEDDHHDDEDNHHDDDHDDEDVHDDDDHDDPCHDAELIEDPHFWLDVVRMQEAAQIVKERLILTFPEYDELIKNNYIVVEKQLEKLQQDYTEALSDVTKPIITNVKLFSYYADSYSLTINPLTKNAHAHEDETTPGDYHDFVDFAMEHEINYILFEKNANSPAGETLLTELKVVNPDASKLELHPGDNLTQEEVRNGKNYINIMYDNLAVLVEATK